MWDCFRAAESVADALCDSFLKDTMDDVDDTDVYKTDVFYDAQSIVESSVSSWSVDSSESINLPMSITFPITALQSSRDAIKSELEDDNSHAPSDERRNEEDSSWDDSASFMTPDQQDIDYQELRFEDTYPDGGFGGASSRDIGRATSPELPFDEVRSLPYTPFPQCSENIVDLEIQKRRAPEIAIDTLSALSHPDDEKEENSTEKELRQDTSCRRESAECTVNKKKPLQPNPELASINDHLPNTLTRTKISIHVPRSPIRRRGMTQILSFEGDRSLASDKEEEECLSGFRETILRGRVIEESPPGPTLRPLCQESPCSSESTVFDGLVEESSIDSSGVGVHWGAGEWHMSRNNIAHIKAVITIQKTVRGHLARNCSRQILESLIHNTAALIIQDWWLNQRATKEQRVAISNDGFRIGDVSALKDTLLFSVEGCEVLLGIQTPPSDFVRTSSMGRSSTSSTSTLSCEMNRGLSPCGQEDDPFLVAIPADGSYSLIPWRLSPSREEFLPKRLKILRLPTITEDEEEHLPDDELGAPNQDVWLVPKMLPSKMFETNDPDEELTQFGLSRSDSSGLIPPPQLRRRCPEFPLNDLSPGTSTPELSSPLFCDDNVLDNQSHLSCPDKWQRIFGIVELARWLQAVTRSFTCRQRYAKLRHAAVTIQTWFRFWNRKRLSIERETEDLRNTCYSPVKSPPLSLSRPPLYPDNGSPRSPKKITSARQSRSTIQRLATISMEGVSVPDAVSESPVTISWPVPDTHYHHRTQLLEIQKTCAKNVFESESTKSLPCCMSEELQVHGARISLETPLPVSQDCRNFQDFLPWSKSHCNSDSPLFLPVPDLSLQMAATNKLIRKSQVDLRVAAVHIQRIVRGVQTRKGFIAYVRGIICFQAIARSHLAHRRYAIIRSSVAQIQGAVRASHYRCEFLHTIKAIIVLKKFFRMLMHRIAYMRKLSEFRQQVAVTSIIQAAFRGWKCRCKLRLHSVAVVEIQRIYRGSVRRGLNRQILNAIVSLQNLFRRRRVRQTAKILEEAAVQIQRLYRGTIYRISLKETMKGTADMEGRNLQLMAAAVVVIQKHERRRAARYCFKEQRYGAVEIQRVYRGSMRRASFKRWKAWHNPAKRIQRVYRGYYIRLLLKRSVAAALVVEKYERRRSAEQRLNIAISSAKLIQSVARAHRNRSHLQSALKAAVTLQSVVRMLICVKSFELKRYDARQCATTFQNWCRSQGALLETESQANAGGMTLRHASVGHKQARQHISTQPEAAQTIQYFYVCYIQRKLCAERTRSIRESLFTWSEKPLPTRCCDIDPGIAVVRKEAAIAIQKATRIMLRRRSNKVTHVFEHHEVAMPSEDCTWQGVASCIALERNELFCNNTGAITAILEDEGVTQDRVALKPCQPIGSSRVKVQCGTGPNRKRSKLTSKLLYTTVVLIAMVACVFRFPASVRPALATSKTALELQFRALQSQITRSSDQNHQMQRQLFKTLNFQPLFTRHVEFSRVPRKSPGGTGDQRTKNHHIVSDLGELFVSHRSAVATVLRLQSAIRTLVKDAVVRGEHHTPPTMHKDRFVMTQCLFLNPSPEVGADYYCASDSPSEEVPTMSGSPYEEENPSYVLGGWGTPMESSPPSPPLQPQDPPRNHHWFSSDNNSLSNTDAAFPTPKASSIDPSSWFAFFRSGIVGVVVVPEEDISTEDQLLALAKDPAHAYLKEWRYLV